MPEGFRFCLPSEAEWEKAARGPEGNEYPWGNKFDKSKCNSEEGAIGGTSPVGKFSPQGDSFYDVADMAGNAWEWSRSLWGSDWMDTKKPSFKYPYSFDDGREDEEAEEGWRIIRGGSWALNKECVRSAFRNSSIFLYYNYVGFRVAVSPFPPEGS